MDRTFALSARLSLAAAAAAVLTTAAPMAAKSPDEDSKASGRKCFWTREVKGFASNDPRTINVSVGVRDVYQFEMFGRCEEVDWANNIVLVSRGSTLICTGLDAEIITPSTLGPTRCVVRHLRKLTAEEIKALPSRARP